MYSCGAIRLLRVNIRRRNNSGGEIIGSTKRTAGAEEDFNWSLKTLIQALELTELRIRNIRAFEGSNVGAVIDQRAPGRVLGVDGW